MQNTRIKGYLHIFLSNPRHFDLDAKLLCVFRDIQSRHGKHLAGEALVGLCQRIREQFGEKVDIGRWSEDTFMVMLLSTKPDALKQTRNLSHRGSAPYVCVEERRSYTLHLKINIGTADFHASEDSDRFFAKAELLRESMG